MISKIAVNRPVTMIMVLIAIILLGSISMVQLPQALMPDIEAPYAIAMVTYAGAGPEEINNLITTPMEQSLASVEGVKNMMSMSYEGQAIVMLEFEMGIDMNFATLDMREKIAMVQGTFPDNATSPMILKMNMDAMPVMQIYAASDMPITELAQYLDDNIISRFERISGVASADMIGATEDVINVDFDQDKLEGYGLSMSTISSMLAAENISLPSGTITNGSSEMIVRTYGEFQNISEISQLPITLNDGSIISLQDVARVTEGVSEEDSVSRLDGKRAIGISISKTSDANIVDLSNEIQKVMSDLKDEFGDKVSFTIGFDQADFIRSSIKSVGESAILGAVLAVIVIFLFLRNFRSTLVIGISIPTSVLATFGLMYVLDMSLNMFTLGALTLAIGMLVDNSVVVLENIFRRNQLGMDAKEAAIQGSREVVLAVMASTLTSIVVYLPIALSGGLSGMIFKDFCFTIIGALVMSLIVAVTIVPMLCSKLLDNSVSEDYVRIGSFFYRYKIITLFGRMITAMQTGYKSAARWFLKRRKRTLALFMAIFIASLGLISMIGAELMPETDEGTFSIDVAMPYGTTIEDKDAFLSNIEEYVLTIPELEHSALSIGATNIMSTSDTSGISVTLVGKNERTRSTEDVMNDVKNHFKDLSGAEVTYSITSSMGTTSLGGADYTLNILGDDVDNVGNATVDLSEQIKQLSGVSEVTTDVEDGTPEVKVVLDRSIAANYGVTSYQLASTLSQALAGTTSTTLKVNGDSIDINLSLSDEYSDSIENMKSIMINTPAGSQVAIGQIANLEYDNSPVAVNKLNQEVSNNINITFNDDVEIQDGSTEVKKLVDSYAFPDGVAYSEDGMQVQMQETFGNLILALIVSILLVYIVLASQFESIILPFMVMMSIPFAMSGAFLALFLTGLKLSMTSLIGLIMLIGIVVNNAILLVEFINQNKETMSRDAAIVEAGSVRLRPILMTTMTTILGMIPMSLGIGEGMEMMAPMGVSIIGGLTASTIITLFLIPVLYAMVDDVETRTKQKRAAKKKVNLYKEALWLAKGAAKREQKRNKKERKEGNNSKGSV